MQSYTYKASAAHLPATTAQNGVQRRRRREQQQRRQSRATPIKAALSPPSSSASPPLDTEEAVRAYVAARPALLARLVPPLQRGAFQTNAAAPSVRLLPMGAINWVWAVTAAAAAAAADNNGDGGNRHRTTTRSGALPACGLLVKHAPPFVRSAGPSFPLSDERLRVEASAMRWAAALVGPDIVPAPLSFDAAASALVAPLLPPHFVPLGAAVLSELAPTDEARAAPAPVRLPWLPARLGSALARLYAATSPAALGREGHARAREWFKNADMVAANIAVVLERPFDAGDAGNAPLPELAAAAKALRADKAAMDAVARARAIYSSSSSSDASSSAAACLVHNDLHIGNCLVAPPRGHGHNHAAAALAAPLALVDFEMATFGAPGYDLGTLAASLVMAAIAAAARAAPDGGGSSGGGSNSSQRRAWLEQAASLLAAAEETVEVAIQNLGRDSRRRGSSTRSRSKALAGRGGGVDATAATAAAASLRQDALLFAAVAMCRLTVGGHKFDGFTGVPSYAQRVWCERVALECGRELLCIVGSGGSNSMRVATDLVRAAIKAM